MIRKKCKSIKELEEHVESFRVRDKEMKTAGMALPPLFTLELLELATEDVPELAALFEDHRMREMKTTEELLDRLEEKAVKWRDKEESTKQANPAGKQAGGITCRYCNKPGHKESECRKKKRDEKMKREQQLKSEKKAAAAAAQAAQKTAADAKKKALAAQQRGTAHAAGAPGGGTNAGGGANAGGKGTGFSPNGAFPPCEHCKRTNHASAHCLYKG